MLDLHAASKTRARGIMPHEHRNAAQAAAIRLCDRSTHDNADRELSVESEL